MKRPEDRTPPVEAPLAVLHRDEWVVAVHKPPGLLVHRSPLSRDEDFLLQRVRRQVGSRVYPVHRLDRATSGVILFAWSPEAARNLAAAFRSREIRKVYHAVARGYTQEAGRIDHPLRSDATGQPREAITEYRRLATVELPFPVRPYPTARYSLLELRPLTGRRHQIRRHLAHVSHPLVGDTAYGKGEHNRLFRREYGTRRLLLVSMAVTFPHPAHGTPVTVETTHDPDVAALFEKLGWPVASFGNGLG